MTIDEARNYLYSSGMSDEQMRTVQGGFICGVLQEIRQEVEELAYKHDLEWYHHAINDVLEIIDKHIKEYT